MKTIAPSFIFDFKYEVFTKTKNILSMENKMNSFNKFKIGVAA